MGIIDDGDDEEMMMRNDDGNGVGDVDSMVLMMLFLLDRPMAMAHGQLWLLGIITKLVMSVLLDFVIVIVVGDVVVASIGRLFS